MGVAKRMHCLFYRLLMLTSSRFCEETVIAKAESHGERNLIIKTFRDCILSFHCSGGIFLPQRAITLCAHFCDPTTCSKMWICHREGGRSRRVLFKSVLRT